MKSIILAVVIIPLVFAGCAPKAPAQQPPPSSGVILSHEGNKAGFMAIDRSRSASAQTALQSDPELGQLRLQVSVFNDTATLTGSVGNQDQKARAESLIRRVPGINKVENNLQITP